MSAKKVWVERDGGYVFCLGVGGFEVKADHIEIALSVLNGYEKRLDAIREIASKKAATQ